MTEQASSDDRNLYHVFCEAIANADRVVIETRNALGEMDAHYLRAETLREALPKPSTSCPHCGGECGGSNGWCADMGKAPRDGSILDLLCRSDCHMIEDTLGLYATIGQNMRDNTGDDVWQTVGWSWRHDCFLDVGGALNEGHADKPEMWRPRPTPPAQEEGE